jgi:valyl-tRNA synthetase
MLGCSCDWSREAFTLDEERAHAVRVAFKRLFDQGLIYRGQYMVNWDPVSLTALADDEVEYEDEEGSLWHIRYPFADGSGRFAVVATTRPETLLGDVAVAVNPTDERYRDVIGHEVELPLTGRRIPIIADDFVKKDFGSGMVKITPAHDPNDFACGQRHGLALINIFTDNARINENGPEAYRGLDRYEARERVVADLKAMGLLEKVEKHPHRVGRGYRSHAIVEPRVSEQWFVKVGPLARMATEAVRNGEIKLHPKAQENTFFAWMENLRDWCISRQLWWGHRIPIWHATDGSGRMICWDGDGAPPEVQANPAAWQQDEDVLDTWFSSALWPFSVMGWPRETPDMAKFFPTSVLVTGHDILFFWVARMMMMSYGLTGQPPFRQVFLHGLIFGKSFYRQRGGDLELIPPAERKAMGLDDMDKYPAGITYKWEKMSKSKGNVIDPLDMFEQFGVDSVRSALVAYTGQGRTIEIDKQRIAGYRNFINKLWNASRFVLTVTEGITPAEFRGGVPAADLRREDRWILTRLTEAVRAATANLEAYSFDNYIQSLYQFLWTDYCDWYVELVKSRVYTRDESPAAVASRRAARIVLLTVLERVLRALHPVIPHATEEIWQLLRERLTGAPTGAAVAPAVARAGSAGFLDAFDALSLCVAAWPTDAAMEDRAACDEVAAIQDVVYAVRNIRGEMAVPLEMKVDLQAAHPSEAFRALLADAAPQVAALAGVRELDIRAAVAEVPFASTAVRGELTLQVPLPAELRSAEVGRLEKEIARLQKGLTSTEAKLANEKFVANAPEALVAAEREKMAKYAGDIEALRARLGALRS